MSRTASLLFLFAALLALSSLARGTAADDDTMLVDLDDVDADAGTASALFDDDDFAEMALHAVEHHHHHHHHHRRRHHQHGQQQHAVEHVEQPFHPALYDAAGEAAVRAGATHAHEGARFELDTGRMHYARVSSRVTDRLFTLSHGSVADVRCVDAANNQARLFVRFELPAFFAANDAHHDVPRVGDVLQLPEHAVGAGGCTHVRTAFGAGAEHMYLRVVGVDADARHSDRLTASERRQGSAERAYITRAATAAEMMDAAHADAHSEHQVGATTLMSHRHPSLVVHVMSPMSPARVLGLPPALRFMHSRMQRMPLPFAAVSSVMHSHARVRHALSSLLASMAPMMRLLAAHAHVHHHSQLPDDAAAHMRECMEHMMHAHSHAHNITADECSGHAQLHADIASLAARSPATTMMMGNENDDNNNNEEEDDDDDDDAAFFQRRYGPPGHRHLPLSHQTLSPALADDLDEHVTKLVKDSHHFRSFLSRVGSWFLHVGSSVAKAWRKVQKLLPKLWAKLQSLWKHMSEGMKKLAAALSIKVHVDESKMLIDKKWGYTTPASVADWLDLSATGVEFESTLHLKLDINALAVKDFLLSFDTELKADAVAQLRAFRPQLAPKTWTLWDETLKPFDIAFLHLIKLRVAPSTVLDLTFSAQSAFVTEPVGVKVDGKIAPQLMWDKKKKKLEVKAPKSLDITLVKGGISDASVSAKIVTTPRFSVVIELSVFGYTATKLAGADLKVPTEIDLGAKLEGDAACLTAQADVAVTLDAFVELQLGDKGPVLIPKKELSKKLWSWQLKPTQWCPIKHIVPLKTLDALHKRVAELEAYIKKLEQRFKVANPFHKTGVLPSIRGARF